MSRKLDRLSSRLKEIKIKVSDVKALADDNMTKIENLEGERGKSSSKLEKFLRRLDELEEIFEDQVNCNSRNTLIIHGTKLNRRNEIAKNNTENTLVNSLCTYFG